MLSSRLLENLRSAFRPVGNNETRPRRYVPFLTVLEDRTLLATCHVTRLGDFGVGGTIGDFSRGDLRFCINHANANPGPDTIDFSVNGTINLTSALPDLQSHIDVQGPGADLITVRRNVSQEFRLFTVLAGATVKVSGLTLTNGGGGVYNAGTLLLSESVLSDNVSGSWWWGSWFGGPGGGIRNEGSLTVIASSVSNNLAGQGGGIWNSGTLTIIDTSVSGNTADGPGPVFDGYGGGIYNTGNITLKNSTVAQNESAFGCPDGFCGFGGAGGGLYNTGTMTLENSTVAHNTASYWGIANGGGIYNSGTLTVLNSTVSSNWAGEGAGIANHTGTLTVQNSMIVSNSAGAFGDGGGIWTTGFATLSMSNTVLANNTDGGDGPDLFGQLDSSGYNLIGNSSGGSGYAPTDVLNVDPLLGPLTDNGGPTLTHALLPGSAAIDAGDNTDAPEWDQRGPGYPRIVNGTIDIGSFENRLNVTGGLQPEPVNPIIFNPPLPAPPGPGKRLLAIEFGSGENEVDQRPTKIDTERVVNVSLSARTTLQASIPIRAIKRWEVTQPAVATPDAMRVLDDVLAMATHA
jgi:hypothetical protein